MAHAPGEGRFGRLVLLAFLVGGCAKAASRRLDPAFSGETYILTMKSRFEPGVTDPALLGRVEPGDIIALSADADKGNSSTVLAIALSQVSHVGIVFPFYHGSLRVLSADSERGVYIDTVENAVRGRDCFIFSFPPGLLNLKKIELFAGRAVFLGRLDYDWSAMFGLNSNLTPNTLNEVGDEYTCATSVAAALHFAGLSLDHGWRGVVTPGDIVTSVARRNLNGPAAVVRPPRREGPVGEGKERRPPSREEAR